MLCQCKHANLYKVEVIYCCNLLLREDPVNAGGSMPSVNATSRRFTASSAYGCMLATPSYAPRTAAGHAASSEPASASERVDDVNAN